MKVYQLSKKLLNRLAKELDAEIYRLCYREQWKPGYDDNGNIDYVSGVVDYVHVHNMDYLCTSKYCDVKLVLKNGKSLHFNLGQQLMVLNEYVEPDFFVEWYAHPLRGFSREN